MEGIYLLGDPSVDRAVSADGGRRARARHCRAGMKGPGRRAVDVHDIEVPALVDEGDPAIEQDGRSRVHRIGHLDGPLHRAIAADSEQLPEVGPLVDGPITADHRAATVGGRLDSPGKCRGLSPHDSGYTVPPWPVHEHRPLSGGYRLVIGPDSRNGSWFPGCQKDLTMPSWCHLQTAGDKRCDQGTLPQRASPLDPTIDVRNVDGEQANSRRFGVVCEARRSAVARDAPCIVGGCAGGRSTRPPCCC